MRKLTLILITILIVVSVSGSVTATNPTKNDACECETPDLITYYVTPADYGLYYIVQQQFCGDGAVFDCKILDEMKYPDAVNEMEHLLACDENLRIVNPDYDIDTSGWTPIGCKSFSWSDYTSWTEPGSARIEGDCVVGQVITITNSSMYTLSVWIKGDDVGGTVRVQFLNHYVDCEYQDEWSMCSVSSYQVARPMPIKVILYNNPGYTFIDHWVLESE